MPNPKKKKKGNQRAIAPVAVDVLKPLEMSAVPEGFNLQCGIKQSILHQRGNVNVMMDASGIGPWKVC